MGVNAGDFPLLPAIGLYAADIRGDGNCLFNALSDQLYGSPNQHHEIRTRTVEYMREHGDYYKQFIEVHPGGGVRRNPKRKNAGAYSTPTHAAAPSVEDIANVFEAHLKTMAQGGVYGDNMEISAFSNTFNVDVKIYQRDFAYMVSGPADGRARHVCHIAYHTWEHYSSVRNVGGPHSGLPEVNPRVLSPEEEQRQQALIQKPIRISSWQVEMAHSSLPYFADRGLIRRTIEECRGDVNRAIEKLLEADERNSASSAQDSSSVEREADSDDDAIYGPNKKRDRRLSRGTKQMIKGNQDRKSSGLTLKLTRPTDSLESLVKASSQGPRPEVSKEVVEIDSGEESEDEDWRPEPLKDGDTSSGSEYSDPKPVQLKLMYSQPASGVDAGVRLKPKAVVARRKGISSRVMKDMKKQAQKAAAKERRQLAAGSKKVATSSAAAEPTLANNSFSFPTISSGIRTLYI